MKKELLLVMAFFGFLFARAQTAEELKEQIAPKKDSIAAIQGRVDALQSQLDALPGWKIGAFGTIGGSISEFNNWFAQGIPNNASGNIGFTVNAYANLQQEKFFWRNAVNVNLAWVKLDDKDDPTDNDGFREATDVFNLSSLYGRKLSEKFAISGLVEYRTTLLSNVNNPGYLDVGVGATWTPITDLVVVIHPLNYNFVFSEEDTIFESSAGAKILADYTKKIGAVSFKSNLSLFQSYEDGDLSNWTWTNSFAYTLWKVIGVGFDFGLRNNNQETLNYIVNNAPTPDPTATFDSIDKELQTYWTLGLSYSF
ncbi:DUF3078 domain-containing protein [Muricauda sp. JGD-17]|uniref:DUF3078 domain-containing protein n=1 Tax=Flagellimonas ochracea TaxID=2696472 RepID=A0A964TB05_9FLAO|nr:DUF3078 domain-containing protein [Allomuricauda ochracea]NAY91547.1 DUF3078 domain-containing protein [Allomuricauda ochracea]